MSGVTVDALFQVCVYCSQETKLIGVFPFIGSRICIFHCIQESFSTLRLFFIYFKMHKFCIFTFKVDVHRTYFSLMNKVSYTALLFFSKQPMVQHYLLNNLFVSDLNVAFLYFKLFILLCIHLYMHIYMYHLIILFFTSCLGLNSIFVWFLFQNIVGLTSVTLKNVTALDTHCQIIEDFVKLHCTLV